MKKCICFTAYIIVGCLMAAANVGCDQLAYTLSVSTLAKVITITPVPGGLQCHDFPCPPAYERISPRQVRPYKQGQMLRPPSLECHPSANCPQGNLMRTIELGIFGIEIDVHDCEALAIRSELQTDCPHCSKPDCFFDCDESQHEDSQETEVEARERLEKNRAYDGIETMLLALAGIGINLDTPAYKQAIEDAVGSVENNIDIS